ncbi:hypothetical protein BS47DRAFT_1490525 [Hydnum rufescens UP504]|uniref:Serine/threonine-protein phosphatase 4 regulatory subunit 3-like central domain-containing protein n=1 Tax=Hydnum rufescens UP504 TaxID=1448309 RepID=A0A9P6ABF8_9AGAM|nr:hypothetical protein BS47DRAFT_1490525 [Hydnum rufescens UP504]
MDKDEQSSFPAQDLGLSPSGVPLRPVHVPDATLPDVSSDDMNIGDNPSTPHDHHVSLTREQYGDDSSLSPLASGSGSLGSRLTAASIVASGCLPEPALGIIGEVEAAIKVIAKTLHGRERICEYLLNEMVSMNNHGIIDYILHEDVFLGIVGILEYDPKFPTHKASYRDFIKNSSKFMQVIEIKDDTIQRKIHQIYQLL